MRLEKKRNEKLAKRKGLAGRTVITVFWLGISFVLAYFLTEYMFTAGYLSEKIFYSDLLIPTAVPPAGLKVIAMFALVMVMQIIFYLGFFMVSPEGRRRTGDPTSHSRNKDPFDDGKY